MENGRQNGRHLKQIFSNDSLMRKKTVRLFHPEVCRHSKNITFEECELAVLRQAVDENEKHREIKHRNFDEMQKLVRIVEDFVVARKLLCYGGTAINNILPESAQFYSKERDIPDYDFFSPNAMADAKKLADLYVRNGYVHVEAKSGLHYGTYKVFVNYIPMADVTQIHPGLFRLLVKHSMIVAGIRYAPPDFLRMSMYLELSRPEGDLSRWEKVLKRLTLLNKYHPIQAPTDVKCTDLIFQRPMETSIENADQIFDILRNVFIDFDVVFFGGYANALYANYRRLKNPDFYVLCEDPDRCATILTEHLTDAGISNVSFHKHDAIGELIPESLECKVGTDTVAFLFKPIACHNYNTITIDRRKIRVATIDTILSFYLAFLYVDDPMFTPFRNRHICLANFLFQLEEKNRLAQKGLLRRFTPKCYGQQETLESIRAKKAEKFALLKTKRDSREYQEWFLNYRPYNADSAATRTKTKTVKSRPRTPTPTPTWNPFFV
jgi:hypothetical protein